MSSQGSLPPILVVDDNADDLFVMRQRLLRSGLQNPVLAFEDGSEAMAYLKRLMTDGEPVPPVMFLDLRMPRCGGFEVLKWVRAQPALVGMAVVIVSTSALPGDSARALQLGAASFLGKFPAPETIREIVDRASQAA